MPRRIPDADWAHAKDAVQAAARGRKVGALEERGGVTIGAEAE